jgi:hypothetical protein
MLDSASEGTFMGKGVEEGTKLLGDMQNNISQWHVERSSRKVNSITETENEEIIAKVIELLGMVKSKENHVNAITNASIEHVDFIARNPYMPAWKSQNYALKIKRIVLTLQAIQIQIIIPITMELVVEIFLH